MRTKILTALLALALTAPLAAQEATSTEFLTADQQRDQANGVVARYEGWEVRCPEGAEGCRLVSRGLDAEGNEVVNIAMQGLPEGSAASMGVTIVTPLLTLLPRGVTVRVDGEAPAGFPFSWCDIQGCYARYGLTADEVQALRTGTAIKVSIFAVTNQGDAIEATISLAGFTAAEADLAAR